MSGGAKAPVRPAIPRETMRGMSTDRWRRFPWWPALVVMGLSLSACAAKDAADEVLPPTITVTTTVTHSPASKSSTASPVPAISMSAQATTIEREELQQVDPELYFGTDSGRDYGYFFQSPSGNLSCGMLINNGELTGCQAWSLVDNLPECDAPLGASSPAIEFVRGEVADSYCLSDGAFSAVAPVLEYGQQLTVDNITCTSRDTGVTCLDQSSGLGFTAARAGFLPFG